MRRSCKSYFVPKPYATLDNNLRRGNRGLPGGSSVAAEVEEVRISLGLAPKARESLSVERVREAIAGHQATHGKYPTADSGLDEGLGCTYGTLNNMLKLGQRGLPGGSSLSREVAAVRAAAGEPVAARTSPLTVERVRRLIRVYHAKHGRIPNQASGPVETLGITFQGLDHALRKGTRGLPGGSSLARECSAPWRAISGSSSRPCRAGAS